MTAIMIIVASLFGGLVWAGRARRYRAPVPDPDFIGGDVEAYCDDNCDDSCDDGTGDDYSDNSRAADSRDD
jgi:hypothetical protein